MQTTGRLFDDIARVASGAAGALSGVREEVEALVKHRLERMMADMDLVPRDEFEAVKEVAATARAEQEKLEARVAALEAALSGTASAKKTTRGKAASKAASSKSAPPKPGAACPPQMSGRPAVGPAPGQQGLLEAPDSTAFFRPLCGGRKSLC